MCVFGIILHSLFIHVIKQPSLNFMDFNKCELHTTNSFVLSLDVDMCIWIRMYVMCGNVVMECVYIKM